MVVEEGAGEAEEAAMQPREGEAAEEPKEGEVVNM